MIFHIHHWKEYHEWIHDLTVAGGKYCKNHYRYCRGCSKWQKYGANYGGDWWEDCDPPDIRVQDFE